MSDKFDELYNKSIEGKIETKKTDGIELKYLSWAFAVAEMSRAYPNWTYEIKMFDNKPYLYDENTGYMVFTEIEAAGQRKAMWLPVMNNTNKAMKAKPYKYTTRWGEKEVEACTMFDINKTIMRCLVKNIAMFGLGLKLYAGEDLESTESEDMTLTEKVQKVFNGTIVKDVFTEQEVENYIKEQKYTDIDAHTIYKWAKQKNFISPNGNTMQYKSLVDWWYNKNKK